MVICFIIQVYWPSSEFYATINSLYVIAYIDILYTGMKIQQYIRNNLQILLVCYSSLHDLRLYGKVC